MQYPNIVSLTRIKDLGFKMAKTLERHKASMGESQLAAENYIEEQAVKYYTLKPSDLSEKTYKQVVRELTRKRSDIIDGKMAAEAFLQCLIDQQGNDMPLPSVKVSEREGKTVFEFVLENE